MHDKQATYTPSSPCANIGTDAMPLGPAYGVPGQHAELADVGVKQRPRE